VYKRVLLIWHVLLEILHAQMFVIKRVVRYRKELSKTVFDIIFTHCLDVVSRDTSLLGLSGPGAVI